MIRILIFLLGILFFVGGITLLASFDSRITGEAFGVQFDGPSGFILGALFFVILAAIYLTHKIKDIIALPAKLRAKDKATKRERGIAALTRGLEAVAIGDGDDAAHHARVARRNLEDESLTRLLTAQAAHLSGDRDGAKHNFSAMLEAPETEFLGLKGLYAQAMAAGETAAARGYAERAFRLRPNAAWAFQSVFDLGLERGAWRETREALASARKNNVVPADKADRAQAALLTADAYATGENDQTTALNELEGALKLAPSLTPAALLAAEIHVKSGKKGKAARVIEAAFTGSAHPALIKFYDRLGREEATDKRVQRLMKLSEKNPTTDEATLLRARAAMLRESWSEAIAELEPLVAKGPKAAVYSLMADAVAALHGDEAAKPWMAHAAAAPLDPRPGADGAFHLTREGWARLIREYMEFARLSPPPIEETIEGLPEDEVRLLLAPPEKETEVETVDAQGDEPAMIVDDAPKSEVAEVGENQEAMQPDEKPGDHVSEREDDHIHNDEEAERAAAAARNVS